MGYNQHQSFYIRERWISKGIKAINQDQRFFFNKDAFEFLGLGKNMVQSLQHWLLATRIAVDEGKGQERTMELTPFGQWVEQNDKTLKYFDTLAILHYHLVAHDEPSTTWYWYFNENIEDQTDKEILLTDLINFVQQRETRVVSENSLKRDIDVLVKMYEIKSRPRDPEEVIYSPFSRLKLIEQKNNLILKREVEIPKESSLLFVKYVLADLYERLGRTEVSIDELMNDKSSLGKAFNLSRNQLVQILNKLTNDKKYKISFTRTNNLDYIRLPELTKQEVLAEV